MLKKGDVDVIAGLNPTVQRSKYSFFAYFKSADTLKVISKKIYQLIHMMTLKEK